LRKEIALIAPTQKNLSRYLIRVLIFCTSAHMLWPVTALAQKIDPNGLPMYGQPGITRPENLKRGDDDFVRDATLKYGGREAAARAFVAQGWEAVRSRKLELAMQRFNQSWLLSPKNYQVFWGFGAVLSDQGKLRDAIEQLQTARELIDDPKQISALLCDIGAVQSEYAARLPPDKQLDRAQHFVIANQSFATSLDQNPNFAPAWREWAISLYRQERYSEAWIKAQRAKELRAEPFPEEFLQDLQKKLADSK
jgi:tetratricopeptide (TPR) repeat protein